MKASSLLVLAALSLAVVGCPATKATDGGDPPAGLDAGADLDSGDPDSGSTDVHDAGPSTSDAGPVVELDGCPLCGDAEMCCTTACDGTRDCVATSSCDELSCPGAFPSTAAMSLALAEGCADVVIYALDDPLTVMMTLRLDAPLQGLVDSMESATTISVDLPDPSLDLVVEVGAFSHRIPCTEPLSASVVQTWRPVSGHATIDLTLGPGGEVWNSLADVRLESVVLQQSGASQETPLQDFEALGVSVGWIEG